MSRLDYRYLLSEGDASLEWAGYLVVWDVVLSADEAQPAFGDADYLAQVIAMLPPGEAWQVDAGGMLAPLLMSIARSLRRVDELGLQMIGESDPGSAASLLMEWERVAGLPDGCVTAPQTTPERRMALTSRLTAAGAQSRAFFTQLAGRLGYEITIDEFASAGEAAAAGIAFTGDGWAYTWRVNVPVSTGMRHFAAGSGAGEPLRSWGDEALECQFNRFKPAHTTVVFAYGA